MTSSTLTPHYLAEVLWPVNARHKLLRNIVLAISGSLLLYLSAKVHIPFFPVPMTMQTYVVLLIGMAFGPRLALGTLVLYMAEGLLGLPVFSGTPERGIGWTYMAGPTGGYLLGFVVAASFVGYLSTHRWDRSFFRTILAMVIGNLIIYAFGYAWLSYIIGAEKAWTFGVQPFLLGDVVKIFLAALTLPIAWKLLNKKK